MSDRPFKKGDLVVHKFDLRRYRQHFRKNEPQVAIILAVEPNILHIRWLGNKVEYDDFEQGSESSYLAVEFCLAKDKPWLNDDSEA